MPPKASTSTTDAPPSPASVQQRPFMPGIAEYELPKTNLIKLAKGSVSPSFCFTCQRTVLNRMLEEMQLVAFLKDS